MNPSRVLRYHEHPASRMMSAVQPGVLLWPDQCPATHEHLQLHPDLDAIIAGISVRHPAHGGCFHATAVSDDGKLFAEPLIEFLLSGHDGGLSEAASST